jgi:hypothetical protein
LRRLALGLNALLIVLSRVPASVPRLIKAVYRRQDELPPDLRPTVALLLWPLAGVVLAAVVLIGGALSLLTLALASAPVAAALLAVEYLISRVYPAIWAPERLHIVIGCTCIVGVVLTLMWVRAESRREV